MERLCRAVRCDGGGLAVVWPEQWLALGLHRGVQWHLLRSSWPGFVAALLPGKA